MTLLSQVTIYVCVCACMHTRSCGHMLVQIINNKAVVEFTKFYILGGGACSLVHHVTADCRKIKV